MRKYWVLNITIFLFIWLSGFASFIYYTQTFKVNNFSYTNAIAVLTGGKQRIKIGINLLKAGYAPILFISGVESPVALKNLMLDNKINEAQVSFGLKATNTKENALEINNFVLKTNLKTLRLVTSSYHMPRALLEIKRVLPANILIIPHPVFIDEYNILFLFKEYHKYILLKIISFF